MENNQEIKTDNQINNNKPWLWKKGQSGNILGRPKGKSMKEYARQYLERMTDEERDDWLEGLPKEIIWKQAEGNPDQNTDVTTQGKPIILPSEIIEKNSLNDSNTSSEVNSEGQT